MNNNVWESLIDMTELLKSISIPVKVGRTNFLIQTISSLQQLAADYFQNEDLNVTYLLTKNKNSDCLEIFFGAVYKNLIT